MLAIVWAVLAISATPMLVTDALFDPPSADCVDNMNSDNCPTSLTSPTSDTDNTKKHSDRQLDSTNTEATTQPQTDQRNTGTEAAAAAAQQNSERLSVEQNYSDLEKATADTSSTTSSLAVPAAPSTTYPAPTCFISRALTPGDEGPFVACLQLRLRDLALYTGQITGVVDKATSDAVRSFQQTRPGLRVDGRPGKATLTELQLWKEPAPAAPVTGPTPPVVNDPPVNEGNYPNWAVSSAGVPYYAGRTACTPAQAATIMTEFARNGAGTSTQQWAVYVASREAGCEHTRVYVNPATRDDSHCAFQLNALSGLFTSSGALGKLGWTTDLVKLSLQTCADAASDFWAVCGRGPWTKPYYCRPSTAVGDMPTRQNSSIPATTPAPTSTTVPPPETTIPVATTTPVSDTTTVPTSGP